MYTYRMFKIRLHIAYIQHTGARQGAPELKLAGSRGTGKTYISKQGMPELYIHREGAQGKQRALVFHLVINSPHREMSSQEVRARRCVRIVSPISTSQRQCRHSSMNRWIFHAYNLPQAGIYGRSIYSSKGRAR